jgi:hypothetical protein
MKNMFLRFGVLVLTIGGIAFVQELQGQELPRLAVVEFTSNMSTEKVKADGLAVRNLVESQMVATGKYQIITRSEIDQLLNAEKIAVSSISSAENVKKLQLQNISYIVTGSVDAMDSDYAVTVKILDVSTGRFSHSASEFMGGSSRDLYNGVNTLVANFVKGISAEGGQVTQNTSAEVDYKTYKIGDTGPGGGIIFAVEGNTGMEAARILGEYDWKNAITTARNHRGGRHSNWHLPTKSELGLIYDNLQRAKVVNLGSVSYWSSSEYSNNRYAWLQRFGDGSQAGDLKSSLNSVLAVRTF